METKSERKINGGLAAGFLLVFAMLLFMSCGGNRGAGYVNNFEELERVANEGRFAIENQWVMPMRGSMIDLTGNSNFIRFKGDSVNLFLPYFGVRQSGGGYGDNAGIEYKGLAEDLNFRKSSNEKNIIVEFEADQGAENFDFRIILFPDGSTNTSVTSSQRDPISYRGHVKELKEDNF